MRFYRHINEKIEFNDELIGTQSGQSDMRLSLFVNGEPAGRIDYTIFQDEVSIKMITIEREFRRMGLGKKLILHLQSLFPKTEIDWGMLTGDGARLFKSVQNKLYVDKARIKKIESLKKEYFKLEQEEERMKKILYGNKKPPQKEIEQMGQRFDVITDRMYDIEQELNDLR